MSQPVIPSEFSDIFDTPDFAAAPSLSSNDVLQLDTFLSPGNSPVLQTIHLSEHYVTV